MHRFNYLPLLELIGLKGTNITSNVCRTGALGITLPSAELQLKGVLFYEGCTYWCYGGSSAVRSLCKGPKSDRKITWVTAERVYALGRETGKETRTGEIHQVNSDICVKVTWPKATLSLHGSKCRTISGSEATRCLWTDSGNCFPYKKKKGKRRQKVRVIYTTEDRYL